MKKIVSVILLFFVAAINVVAQDIKEATQSRLDTIYNAVDSMSVADSTTVLLGKKMAVTKPARDWETWKPSPKRAMWLALVIPGAGQIYNRKFWKLPIIYGGMMGCVYAWSWNNQMYSDYSQAYKDLATGNINSVSVTQVLRGRTIDASNKDRYTTLFKSRKDRFRRWRDLSIFCLIGVYAISVIDAYVDAQLSEFDISPDLTMKVTPAYLNTSGNQLAATRSSSLVNGGLGVKCQLNF